MYDRKFLIQAVNNITSRAAQISADKYAPKGWTLQLARGINAEPAKIEGDFIVGKINATAKSKSGFDYAKKQHDEKLRHALRPPMTSGFVNIGRGIETRSNNPTDEAAYHRGYRTGAGYKYKSQYITKALNEIKPYIDKEIDKALKQTLDRMN